MFPGVETGTGGVDRALLGRRVFADSAAIFWLDYLVAARKAYRMARTVDPMPILCSPLPMLGSVKSMLPPQTPLPKATFISVPASQRIVVGSFWCFGAMTLADTTRGMRKHASHSRLKSAVSTVNALCAALHDLIPVALMPNLWPMFARSEELACSTRLGPRFEPASA